MEFTAPQEAPVVMVANSAELTIPKRVSLPSMLPPGLGRGNILIHTQCGEGGIALLFGIFRHGKEADEQQRHGNKDRPALTGIAHHAAEGVAESGWNQEDRQHGQEIGEGRGILERVRRVGIEEAAAIGAELLDRFLRGDRPHGEDLFFGGRLLGHRMPAASFSGLPAASSFGLS